MNIEASNPGRNDSHQQSDTLTSTPAPMNDRAYGIKHHLQDSDTFAVGSTLAARYQLLKPLGAGGMGFVFQSIDLVTGRRCAVKAMHANLSGSDKELTRFHREASLSLTLKHPNIVEVYELGVTEIRKPFIVMEYLAGSSLADLLERHTRLELANALPIFLQICEAISFAHDNNVVHRDIKPGNIMIVEMNGVPRVKIVDFGIAKVCKTTGEICPTTARALRMLEHFADATPAELDSLQHLTQPGEIFGSPLYMSPEQCRGEEADCRSEVYAIGCMIFECLTGDTPLTGNSAIETLIMRVNDAAPSINDIVPGLSFPTEIDRIVSRALASNPDERYQTVAQLAKALKSL